MYSSGGRSSFQALGKSSNSSVSPKTPPSSTKGSVKWAARAGGGRIGYHSAAERGDTEAIRHLLKGLTARERETRVNAFNRFGFAPIHAATFYEQNEALRTLLDLGADPNLRTNRSHWTYPLHLAAFRGSSKALKILIEAGADPYLQDWQGFNALNVADLAGHKAVAPLLRARMEAAQETLTNGIPIQLEDNNNGYNDLWWRVRQVHWRREREDGEGSDSKRDPDKGDDTTDSLAPLVVDHYSDGGTPAPTLALHYEARRQWCPRRLYRVASQPLTLCEREQAQNSSRPLNSR